MKPYQVSWTEVYVQRNRTTRCLLEYAFTASCGRIGTNQCRDQLAQLTHMMSCIDQDNWMTDGLLFKVSMSTREVEKSYS